MEHTQFKVKGHINKTTPYALNLLVLYDGNGNTTGTIQGVAVGGNVITNVSTQGTYQVNTDCSYTSSVIKADGTTGNYSGIVFDDGDKFISIETDFDTIINIKGERVRNYYSSH